MTITDDDQWAVSVVADDTTVEGDEDVVLTVVDDPDGKYVAAAAPDDEAAVTIGDDDGWAVSVEATDATGGEPDNDSGEFTFTRSGADNVGPLEVEFAVGGSATRGDDYTLVDTDSATTVVIPDGDAGTTVGVDVDDDLEVEGDETVVLTVVDDPDGDEYVAADSPDDEATVTIADNDDEAVTPPPGEDTQDVQPAQPTSGTGRGGDQICRTGTAVDENGDPVAGETLGAELTGANEDAGLAGQTGDCSGTTTPSGQRRTRASSSATTGTDGQASFTYSADTAGNDTLVVFADYNDNGVRDGDEPFTTYQLQINDAARHGGTDRRDTAIQISRDLFADHGDDTDPRREAGAVVLSRDDDFPDAMAGTPFAVANGAPLLLTPSPAANAARGNPPGIDPDTRDEIDRVLPDGGTVYLLGLEKALGPAVEDDLDGRWNVERIGGQSRFETAVAIAERTTDDPANIFITTGLNFPDALAAGAAAAATDGVVVLSFGENEHPATNEYAAGEPGATLWGVGGPAARAYPSAQEIAGADRFATARQVADRFFDAPEQVGIARFDLFPDSLSGGAHIGHLGGPLLLTNTDDLEQGRPGERNVQTRDYLRDKAADTFLGRIYGGTVAVSNQVQSQVRDAIE